MAAEKPNVAWIHGLGRSRRAIMPFAEALLPDVQCWATNLLGHGDRPVPPKFSTETFALDLLDSYDRAGIRNPYLVGWSYGGRVALYLARNFPDRFPGICLLGMNFEQRRGIAQVLDYYDPDRPRKEPLSEHRRSLYRTIHNWFLEQLNEPPQLTEEILKEIRTPVLIFAGKSDPIVPVRDAEILYASLPNARLSLFDGSIHPSREHPGRDVPLSILRREILQFVVDVESGRFHSDRAVPETALTGSAAR
jgi:pimeloyl-ACP methyl ester carboxylesterase